MSHQVNLDAVIPGPRAARNPESILILAKNGSRFPHSRE
jgi:hypothetical protein